MDEQRTGRQLHRARSAIARLKNEQRWVPVAERLPDDDITVLVACKEGDEPVWLGYHDETGWVSATDGVPIEKLVTHWKPMPDGPKRGDL